MKYSQKWKMAFICCEDGRWPHCLEKEDYPNFVTIEDNPSFFWSIGRWPNFNQLSVDQLVAYHSVNLSHKIYHSSKPIYHHDRLFESTLNYSDRRGGRSIQTIIDFDLSLSRTSFFFQASGIFYLSTLDWTPHLKPSRRCLEGGLGATLVWDQDSGILEYSPVNDSYAKWMERNGNK